MRATDTSALQRAKDVISGGARSFVKRQTVYTVVSSALPGILAVMFLIDLIFGHPHINRGRVTLWFSMFGIFTLLPLIWGRKYPRFGGIALIVVLNVWTWAFVTSTNHAHTEVNALLQVPMLALYVGWFYSSWVARISLAINMLVVVAAMEHRGWQTDHDFSSGNAAAYALVVSWFCLEIAARLRKSAQLQSRLDQLTGVWNRRGLAEVGLKRLHSARKSGHAISLAVVDFDDFKKVNDNEGHAAGDAALRATAVAWVDGLEDNDFVARIGGDEFVLIVHGTEAQVSQKMIAICEKAQFSWSWGVAQLQGQETLDELLSRADTAMYRAKAQKHD